MEWNDQIQDLEVHQENQVEPILDSALLRCMDTSESALQNVLVKMQTLVGFYTPYHDPFPATLYHKFPWVLVYVDYWSKPPRDSSCVSL